METFGSGGALGESVVPSLLELHRSGELTQRVDEAVALLSECRLCGRDCGVNRLSNQRGECGIGRLARVSSAFAHRGEEAVLSGNYGSGTVFLSGCSLHCVFCQNYDVSHDNQGHPCHSADLADLFEMLVSKGCHNVNLVTPTHVMPQLLEGFLSWMKVSDSSSGAPIVWNTSGYDSLQTLRLLDGVVDIYMPDVKMFDRVGSERYFRASEYPDVVRSGLKEMFAQVGPARFDSNGLMLKGVLVRHLVMPQLEEDSRDVIDFLAREFSDDIVVNVMGQYMPAGAAYDYPALRHRPRLEVVADLKSYARGKGLRLEEQCKVKVENGLMQRLF